MDAIEALRGRVSVSRLQAPGPDRDQVEQLLQAAMRAPDHGSLRPWRFLVLEGEQLRRLGEIFARAVQQDQPGVDEPTLERIRDKPPRAPMVIVAVAEVEPASRIPVEEQVLATGAAVQNMMVAAHALGLGAMWRTGNMAFHPEVRKGLGFAEKDRIVAFVYLGTPVGEIEPPAAESPALYVRRIP